MPRCDPASWARLGDAALGQARRNSRLMQIRLGLAILMTF